MTERSGKLQMNGSATVLAVAVAALLAMPVLGADLESPGITVSATGEAKLKPNRMEIEIKASAAAELTTDALVKYRDALKHGKETFEKLKIENLSIEDQGVTVASSGPNNESDFSVAGAQPPAGGPARVKQEVGISKSLRLKISGIDKMSEEEVVALAAKLLDVARDSGLAASAAATNSMISRMNGMAVSNPMVTFYADDAPSAEQKASDDAFEQAKTKAERLAKKAGVQLGSVLSIDESPMPSGERTPAEQIMVMMMMSEMGAYEPMADRLTSYTLTGLPVRVTLRVRFAIQPAGVSK